MWIRCRGRRSWPVSDCFRPISGWWVGDRWKSHRPRGRSCCSKGQPAPGFSAAATPPPVSNSADCPLIVKCITDFSWDLTAMQTYGIQRVMVSNGSWFQTGHGIKSCYLKVEVLQRVLLGLKGFGTDATDVAPWQLQVVDGHVLEDPVPQVDHAAVVHVQQVNHLLTNPSTTFSWLAFERLPSTLANGPYNSAGLRTLLRVLVLIMNLNCWTTPTEVSLQMSSMSALVMSSKTGSYFHVFRWIRSCNADWLLQSISASVLWDKVRYFLLAAKRISDQLHYFFFFFPKCNSSPSSNSTFQKAFSGSQRRDCCIEFVTAWELIGCKCKRVTKL